MHHNRQLAKDSLPFGNTVVRQFAIVLAALVMASVLVTGCKPGPPSATPPTGLNSEFQLKMGQRAQVAEGLAITFKEVTEDSRCPVDVECIWAGQAVVVIEVINDGVSLGDSALTLGTPDSQAARIDIPGYRIEALDLAPEPRSEGIEPSEYAVTLLVSAE